MINSIRTPETFDNSQAFIADFDNTIARTFEPSPNGIDVPVAYEYAIDEVFGPRSVDIFLRSGGLRNRTPIEVVRDLSPFDSEEVLSDITHLLVASKLSILMNEVGSLLPNGKVWPRPTRGYYHLLELLNEMNDRDGLLVDQIILSSGHESFIKKVFTKWDLRMPDLVIADETVEKYAISEGIGLPVKPDPVLIEVVNQEWRSLHGLGEAKADLQELDRMVLAGDDMEKDGGMAEQAGIDFVCVNPDFSVHQWPNVWLKILDKGKQLNEAKA